MLCFALIETGCRPSELSNILPENICLDADVPHIRIRSTKERQLKSKASIRDIPLVGVSLEAMKLARNGFPHYTERGYLLSQSLMKAFKARKLIPSDNHRIYSFRHSFKSRMLTDVSPRRDTKDRPPRKRRSAQRLSFPDMIATPFRRFAASLAVQPALVMGRLRQDRQTHFPRDRRETRGRWRGEMWRAR